MGIIRITRVQPKTRAEKLGELICECAETAKQLHMAGDWRGAMEWAEEGWIRARQLHHKRDVIQLFGEMVHCIERGLANGNYDREMEITWWQPHTS